MAAMFDLMLGGAPTPGLVVGGGFVLHGVPLRPAHADSQSSYNPFLTTMGIFASVYPIPRRGLNVHLLLGYGILWNDSGSGISENPKGPSVMGGTGYEFWISERFSIGPEVRLAYFRGTHVAEDFGKTVSMTTATASIAATYR
jgi:hypothetical protein